jgi:isopentenyl diphosphate isomerase/L-lactate dehydrogenase-like FMN-dependent dehydrogenase
VKLTRSLNSDDLRRGAQRRLPRVAHDDATLAILAAEVDRVMALIGCADVSSITPEYLISEL